MPRRKTQWAGGAHPWERVRSETRLAEWMQEQQVSIRGLAETLGLGRKRVEYWVNGQVLPTLIWAFKLEKATGGAVPASSWLATEMGRKAWETEGSEELR